MSKKLITYLMVFLLILTGCTSKNGPSKRTEPTKSASASSSKGAVKSNKKQPFILNDSASQRQKSLQLEAYKKVLLNKVEFFSTDDNKYVYLKNYVTEEFYGIPLKVTHFTILDMNGDKIPEVVLELSNGDYPDCFEVLHYMNGTVHGYNFVYRALEELKKDGTFWASSGAADNDCGKLRFESNACETDILGHSKLSFNNGIPIISYFINQKRVTEESFKSFSKKQDGKEDVVWFKFSQNNIETELAIHNNKFTKYS